MNRAEMRIKNIWSTDQTYANYRIPGILVTSKSTVIIDNESRMNPEWIME